MEISTSLDPLKTVHKSVYSKNTFELEKERIFQKVWIFVGHESEFPQIGSYMAKTIADQPLVFVKDPDEVIRGFYNTCRHRGSVVVTEDEGKCNAFICPYHHWSYSLKGDLLGVPGIAAYNDTGFKKEEHGLIPVRVESMFGLIFVCLDENMPTLAEYMGEELVELLRLTIGQVKFEIFAKESFNMIANWKLPAENARDGYHVPFVHPFLSKGSPPREYNFLDNGHAVQRISYAKEAVDEEMWEITQKYTLPGLNTLDGYVIVMFPDLIIQPRNNVFQILSQFAVDEKTTIFEERAFGIVGDTMEQRVVRKKCWEVWCAGQPPEDLQALEWQQKGIMSKGMPISIIARGQDATKGIRGDDNRLRQFWEYWRQYMGFEQNVGIE